MPVPNAGFFLGVYMPCNKCINGKAICLVDELPINTKYVELLPTIQNKKLLVQGNRWPILTLNKNVRKNKCKS
jgi:hypothetical protein